MASISVKPKLLEVAKEEAPVRCRAFSVQAAYRDGEELVTIWDRESEPYEDVGCLPSGTLVAEFSGERLLVRAQIRDFARNSGLRATRSRNRWHPTTM